MTKGHKDSIYTAKQYNKIAQEYHSARINNGGKITNDFMDIPTTLSLLPRSLHRLILLDAGCGCGVNATIWARKGAVVKGIDISKSMIDIAVREKPQDLDIDYSVADLYKIPFPNESFDIIISNYVLGYVKDLKKVFFEFSRVLKKGGLAIISESHPVRILADKKHEGTSGERWEINDYFDKSTRISSIGIEKYKTNIQDYSDAMSEAGFQIVKIKEPQPIRNGYQVDKKLYNVSMTHPQLIVYKIIKV